MWTGVVWREAGNYGPGGIGFAVDIAHLRRDQPDVRWHTFADWALNQDWGILNQPARVQELGGCAAR
jgi:hypothetical protein